MLLLWLILIPFFLGLLSWQSERIHHNLPRWVALFGVGVVFIIVSLLCYEYIQQSTVVYNVSPQWQKKCILPWIPCFGINIYLALDGLSLLMIILSALLGFLAVLCSWRDVKRELGLFYFNLLWLFSCVIGIFLSIDMFLFFVFWEMMIFPMYLLISLWGYRLSSSCIRIQAATKFFIYSQLSGLILLIAILGLVFVHYDKLGVWTFNYEDLLFTPMSNYIEFMLMLGFFVAFAVKLPIVPLHGWLPDVHSQAPISGSVDLIGVLLKTAAYGLLRFNLPLFPHASKEFSFIAICLGIFSIFYSGVIAFSQTDIKRLIAYAGISHMGFILLGVYSGNLLAFQGVIIHMIAHSLSSSGMFILCGQLFERLRVRDMRLMGGLWDKLRLIPGLSLFFSASMLGLPGTGNFVGEITILFGSFQEYPLASIIASFGLILSSIYSLILMHRVYYGTSNVNYDQLLLYSMTFREKFIIFVLLFLIVFFGFFPQSIINISIISMHNIQQFFTEKTVSLIISG